MSLERRRMTLLLAGALSVLLLTTGAAGAAADPAEYAIPFEKFVLDNGLTLIVHEDHKAPIVAINVWYHVGSKNEKQGRTGFAHLFEHLMFNGSENFNDDYFQAMAKLGATDLNGTTNNDRTNYFQNVPVSALDTVLWLESDRMGHLIGAIDQDKLDEQRGVVQNEKRQGENQPYAISRELITKQCFPEGHPYSWTVIGSMEDLDAASLEDVHGWFEEYYGAANAVIVLAGDIDAAQAKQHVEKYFGEIPSGPPVVHPEVWVARRTESTRQLAEDRVSHPRLYRVWNVPQWGSLEHDQLELVSSILTSGKTSRLYKRLVYEDQIARSVYSYVDSREIASLFTIVATAQSGVELSTVERAIDEELDRLLTEGPTEEELNRVRTQYFADFVRGIERIGGFGGKSDILARSQVYGGAPDAYLTAHRHVREATTEQLHATSRRWLSEGAFTLEIQPFPEYRTLAEGADRSKLPEAAEPPVPRFVKIQREKLANGLEIVLAERHDTPLVDLNLMVDAGYASDQFSAAGTASLAMNMLDEGAGDRDALQISEELDLLGAELSAGSNLDVSTVFLSSLTAKLDRALGIFADVILRPTFPQAEFDRLKKQQLAAIEAEKTQPFSMALRVFPTLLYGADHAYGTPFTGSGTAASVGKLTRDDMARFHETWFKPNNATLVVVGDTTMGEIRGKLQAAFGDWKKGKVPQKNIATVAQKDSPSIYLIDKPGAIQSIILAGHVVPGRGSAKDVAYETMNTILGGTFVSRLNMNLREDKHWSYGSGSVIVDARGQRPFLVYAPVQTDKTRESILEVQKELDGICGDAPVTGDELAKIKDKQVRELPGSWETIGEVGGSLAELVRFDLPDDYFDRYPERVRSLSREQVDAAAKEILHPHKLVWVVVGDRAKIEAGIRDLGLGEIHLMDADGKRLD